MVRVSRLAAQNLFFFCLLRLPPFRLAYSRRKLRKRWKTTGYTLPANVPHSASEGVLWSNEHWVEGETLEHTITTGVPISFSSWWHYSLCSPVTLTIRRKKRSTSSLVPAEYISRNRVMNDDGVRQPTCLIDILSFRFESLCQLPRTHH